MLNLFAGFLATIAILWLFALPAVGVWVWCRMLKPSGVNHHPRHHATRAGQHASSVR